MEAKISSTALELGSWSANKEKNIIPIMSLAQCVALSQIYAQKFSFLRESQGEVIQQGNATHVAKEEIPSISCTNTVDQPQHPDSG